MKKYKLYLLDMDGTLYLGDKLFSCTKPFLEFVRKSGGSYAFLTNNSSKSVSAYIKKLASLGIEAKAEDFFTSTNASVLYIKKNYPDTKVFAMGTRSFVEELKSEGINVTEEPETDVGLIIMGYDTELTYKKLEDICTLLRRGIDYVATNPDLVCPTEDGFVPDCGSVSIMLKNATGREPYFIGKPEPAMVELCLKKRSIDKADAVIVGDRIYTDIASGLNAGIDAVLVMSGETDEEILNTSPIKPTYVIENVASLIMEE